MMVDGLIHVLALVLPLLGGSADTGGIGLAGTSVLGHDIGYQVLGDGPETVMFIATVHGNEWAGTPLLVQLRRRLMDDETLLGDNRVVLVPMANPDGHRRKRRWNKRGVDLNRNFPAPNWKKRKRTGTQPLSEPETRALVKLIKRFTPTRIITIHQPLRQIDYDGPGKALAKRMAKRQPNIGGKKLRVKRLGGRAGSLGSWAGKQLRIPVITLELPKRAHRWSPMTLWRRYGGMLLAAITPDTRDGRPRHDSKNSQ